ncbi:MAG: hypothetical protein GY822_21795 [Deltaproteobacteria bacterium]|nr:hypothetical protein [Deltaproteobacteria bacterium]
MFGSINAAVFGNQIGVPRVAYLVIYVAFFIFHTPVDFPIYRDQWVRTDGAR